jgi:lipopolysaccharide export system permease protein
VVDLTEGRRYEIYPGTAKYSQAEFANYRLRLENDKEAKFESAEVEALKTSELWKNRQDPVIASELGWRVFVPFAIVIALILATALSEVSPRQGRYLKLFPALLIFASLIVALMAVKTRVSKEEMGMWAYPLVLLVYAIAAALFSRKQSLAPKIRKKLAK